jgi:hypothetical protein
VSLGVIHRPSGTAQAALAAGGVVRRNRRRTPPHSWPDRDLPELKKTKETLHDELCKEGPGHCPTMLFEKGESHMSEVFRSTLATTPCPKPILDWMKKIK